MTPHKHAIQLSTNELTQLQDITRKGKHNSRVIRRAHILLLAHAGISKNTTAKQLALGRTTVQRIRMLYYNHGLTASLYDASRSGRPRKLDDRAEAHLVAVACSDPPEGRERWTLELLKKRMINDKQVTSISDVCILTYLHNRGIKPWREKNVVYPHSHARVH